MSFRAITISDLGQIVTGKTPSTSKPAFFNGEYQFVTPSDLDWKTYYCHTTERTVTDDARKVHHNQFIPSNAVMVTCIGNTMGKCGLSSRECLTNQQINSIIPMDGIDSKFVYYLLVHNTQVIRGVGLGGGSATPILNKTSFSKVRLRVPPQSQWNSIASFLSAYDDLIENNRRRIQLLEQAGRLLYREWFVRLRFPGHEHVKIIDGVPEGWERKYVPKVIDINPTEKVQKGTAIRYVPMAGLSTKDMTINLSESEIRTTSTSVRYRNGDVLLARITPCLENGKTGFVNFLAAEEIACGSTEFIILRGRYVSPYFTYCLARTHEFRETAIKSMIGSSGRQRVQPACFDEFVVGLPKTAIQEQFDASVSPLFQQIAILMRQFNHLAKARDLLLPRLMNGEVAV